MIKKILIIMTNIGLSILIFLLLSILLLNITVMDSNYIKNSLNKSNYYKETYELVKKDYKAISIQLKIGESTLPNIYQEEDIINDTNNILDSIYNNKGYNINRDNLKERLDNEINELLKINNNRVLTQSEKEEVNKLEDEIIDDYILDINYLNKYTNTIKKYFNYLNKFLKYITIFVLLITIIIYILNIVLSKKLNIIPIMTSSIIMILLKIIINGRYKNILVLNIPISKTIIYIIDDVLNKYQILGIIIILISIFLISVKTFLYQKSHKNID